MITMNMVIDKNLYVSKHVKSMKENIPEKYFNNKNENVTGEDSFNTNTKNIQTKIRTMKNTLKKMSRQGHFENGCR